MIGYLQRWSGVVLALAVCSCMPVLAIANTVASSTMYFEGALADQGNGVLTGTIAMTPGKFYVPGGPGATISTSGGFDVYAANGGCAFVENYYGTGAWNCGGVDTYTIGYIGTAPHDGYPDDGGGNPPWGDYWNPDCADYYNYELVLDQTHWYLRYNGGTLGNGNATPMSGAMDWVNLYATESDIGAYVTPPADPDANDGDAADFGAGAGWWDMDWTWGSDAIPLEQAGFSVQIMDLGSGQYQVALIPSPALSVDADWEAFVIRENATDGAPYILGNDNYGVAAVEFIVFASGQKAALGTNAINHATVSQISTLHIDRLDDIVNSGSLYGPYFNIWVTDGEGHYAVIANEPSDGEWAGSRWDVSDWDFLKTKRCKVYETVGASGGQPGTSWVATYTGQASDLVFEDVADLIILPPPASYIAAGNGVGSGAPDELGTNIAYGFNWIFGDTASNYVSGGGEGFVVANYSATANFPVNNITQGTGYSTIQAAINDADAGDEITIAAGTYNERPVVNKSLTLTGEDEATVIIDAGAATSGSYGMSITADNVTIQDLTLVGDTGMSTPRYGFKPSNVANLHMENVTATEFYRTGIDLLGVDGCVLEDVSALGNGGHGFALTDCNSVIISDAEATGNGWSPISIATWGRYSPLGTSGIEFENTLSYDGIFQIEMGDYNNPSVAPSGDAIITYSTDPADGADVTLPVSLGFMLHGEQDDAPGQVRVFPFETLADATAAAAIVPLGHMTGVDRYIESLNEDGVFYVVPGCSIQAAVDAAEAGDLVMVMDGTYVEDVTIPKALTLQGNGATSTILKPTGTAPAITVSADNVTIKLMGITSDVQLVEGIRVVAPAASGLTLDTVHFPNLGNNPGPGNAYGVNVTTSFTGLSVSNSRFIATNLGEYSRAIGIFAPNHLDLHDLDVASSVFEYLFVGVYLRSNIDGLTATGNTFGPFEFEDCKAAVSGIYIGDGDQGDFDINNISVTGNTFTDYGRGVYMWNYADGETIGKVDITGNTFSNTIWSSGIRLIGKLDPETQVATIEGPITIDNNTFTQSVDVGGSGGVSLIEFRCGGESATSQLNVTNNNIAFTGPIAIDMHGIMFRGPATNATVFGNTILGNDAFDEAVGTPPASAIILATDDSWLGPIASSADIDIESNTISGFVNGVSIYDRNTGLYGNLPAGASVEIHGNTITGNVMGIQSGDGEVVDAECNYWGTLSYVEILPLVSGNVDFDPWSSASLESCSLTAVNVVYVDDDWAGASEGDIVGAKGGYIFGYNAFATIQDGIDAVSAGGIVHVAAGLYEEQLHITKDDLSVLGAGKGGDSMVDTIVLSPVALTWFYHTSNDNYPVVGIDGATGVTIQDLRVDGDGRGNGNYRFQGIGFWNAGGTISNCDVVDVIDTPFSGSQHGVGIYSYNNTGGPYTINLTGVEVTGYQKGGIALNGAGLTATVTGCTTVGAGPTDVTAQNGIQLYGSAGGAVTNCSVSGNVYTGSGWSASGLLLMSAGTVSVTGSTFSNNDPSVFAQDTQITADGITILNTIAEAGNGFYVRGQNGVSKKALKADPVVAEKPAQPFGDFEAAKEKGTRGTITAVLQNSTLTGAGSSGYGVSASNYVVDDTIDLTVTNCTVTSWQYGFVIFGSGGDVTSTVSQNSIAGNLNGFYSALADQNAECNWWGSSVYEVIADTISEVVDYEPWLTSEGGDCDGTVDPPALRIDIDDADSCYQPGETLTVTVIMGITNHYIGGAQMFLTYDDAVLELASVTPGTDLREVYYDDAVSGELVYGVGVNEGDDPIDGTLGETLLATVSFTILPGAVDNCELEDAVAFAANGLPPNATYLTTVPAGRLVPTELTNAPAVVIDGTDPVITAPANITVDAEAGVCEASLVSSWTHTFDDAPVLEDDDTDGAWYVDRYAPAVFTNEMFAGDMRLKHGVSEADSQSNRPAGFGGSFYDKQGRKYNFSTPSPWSVQIDLYVDPSWPGMERQAGLWGTVLNGVGAVKGYPILVYTEGIGFQYWDDVNGGYTTFLSTAEVDYGNWYTMKFTVRQNEYVYSVSGSDDAVEYTMDRPANRVRFTNVILNLLNYGETYDVYWDNLVLGPVGPEASDNCGVYSIAYERSDDPGLSLSDPFDVGSTDVVWTATDCAGNSASATQVITVEDNELPTIACPGDVVVDAAPGDSDAYVTVPVPTTADNCGVASVINDWNSMDDASAVYPVGTTPVVFTVTDVHGNQQTCSFTVTVNPAPVVVFVDIEGNVVGDPVTRCVEFVFTNCSTVTEVRTADIDFAAIDDGLGGYYWSGAATFTDLPVATYTKVSAQDEYHTLTRVVVPTNDGVDWVADFTGANILLQGDLYDDTAEWGVDFVDIVDFGVYASEWGWSGDPNTPCLFAGLYHPDMDGDGALDSSDYAFINRNFLESGDTLCSKGMRDMPQPRRSISIEELKAMGLGHLSEVDYNNDGMLDGRDVKLFMIGGTPAPQPDPGSISDTLEPVQVDGTMDAEAGLPAKGDTIDR